MPIELIHAHTDEHIALLKKMFVEYGESLDFKLCFQSFDTEVAGLPGDYAQPEGRLILAYADDKPAGCIGLRKIETGVCEMKRLWVRPDFRGLKLGRILAEYLLDEAKTIGYNSMRLDTVSTMTAARGLYKSLGFVEIESYYHNPQPDVIYMEKVLTSTSAT